MRPQPKATPAPSVEPSVEPLFDDPVAVRAPPLARVDPVERRLEQMALEDPDLGETPPWAERMVRFLDDGIRVPGTEFRFGLDAIIGALFPGVGDLATALGTVALLFLALREGVPTAGLARMIFHIFVDVAVGLVPVLGDGFDLLYKANRKNLDLIERYRDDPEHRPSVLDYGLVAVGVLLLIAGVVAPFALIWLLFGALGGGFVD